MQFEPTADYLFFWPVKVIFPDPDNPGAAKVEEFKGQFRLMPDGEAVELQKALQAAATPEGYVAASKAQIKKVLVGWDGVLTANKKPDPFSAERLEQYLTFAPLRDAVIQAYGEALAKRPAEGN